MMGIFEQYPNIAAWIVAPLRASFPGQSHEDFLARSEFFEDRDVAKKRLQEKGPGFRLNCWAWMPGERSNHPYSHVFEYPGDGRILITATKRGNE